MYKQINARLLLQCITMNYTQLLILFYATLIYFNCFDISMPNQVTQQFAVQNGDDPYPYLSL